MNKVSKKRNTKEIVIRKHPIMWFKEMSRSGGITRKGLLITLGIVIVASGIFTGYSLWQNAHVKAGGLTTIGRTYANGVTSSADQFAWTSEGSLTAPTTPVTTIAASACKVAEVDGNFAINLKGSVSAGDGSWQFVPVGNDESGAGSYLYASDPGDQGATTTVGNVDYLENGYASNISTQAKAFFGANDKLQVYFTLRNASSGISTSAQTFTVSDLVNCT